MMEKPSNSRTPSRRKFLTATGGVLAAAAASRISSAKAAESPSTSIQTNAGHNSSSSTGPWKKIPIGVFDPAFPDLSLDQMLDKVAGYGLEAMEIGTGGYPDNHHCPLNDLLADPAKLKVWKKKFDDRKIVIGALSCHGNPVHPDAKIAGRDAQTFRNTVLLAEKLGVQVIVGFSGCPGGSPTDTTPNWVTYRWPPEYGQALDWQ
jgi:sugar phosphate isomerase/epimerase